MLCAACNNKQVALFQLLLNLLVLQFLQVDIIVDYYFAVVVQMLLAQRDTSRLQIHKKRRCFLWDNHYFQLDIYQEPCLPK